MKSARFSCGASAIGNYVFVAGGADKTDLTDVKQLVSSERFNTVTNSW